MPKVEISDKLQQQLAHSHYFVTVLAAALCTGGAITASVPGVCMNSEEGASTP